ncbi:MAG: HAD family hydrolase [Gammaproteobacteria bacterium]|nr:HAD family hydrolase [Gammaproteobacteria bacterium]|tara:strand:+ start:2815 stop:3459 length:645 start_codon:yes stop_codon:yes gene_type:complete
MTIKAAIFDWDGTVVDSIEHISNCLHHAATSIGYPALERAAYSNIIGLGLVEALRTLYPTITSDDMVAMRDAYSSHFMATAATAQKVFPGITDILQDLHSSNRHCAVATGKSRRGLDRALEHSQLGSWFHITRCADETRSKPDPSMLVEILNHLQLEPSDAVMIGDTSYDLEMAANIGMPSIGVPWGAHHRDILARHKPIAIASSVAELRELLR